MAIPTVPQVPEDNTSWWIDAAAGFGHRPMIQRTHPAGHPQSLTYLRPEPFAINGHVCEFITYRKADLGEALSTVRDLMLAGW